MQAFEWANAKTTDDAVRLLSHDGAAAGRDPDQWPHPIGGGQDLHTTMKAYIVTPPRVVNLKTIPDAGRIRILGSDKYKGVLVPEDALGSDQDRRVVYVVGADNTIALKPVRVGSRVDGYRVIREGLKGDETIVVNGLMRVRPGIKVDPKLTTLPATAVAAAN